MGRTHGIVRAVALGGSCGGCRTGSASHEPWIMCFQEDFYALPCVRPSTFIRSEVGDKGFAAV